jgi:hypothetical protein
MSEAVDLRTLLLELDPKARDALHRVLIHDQANRDAICKLYGGPLTFMQPPKHEPAREELRRAGALSYGCRRFHRG